jgi:radical SAM superfamily enzyme
MAEGCIGCSVKMNDRDKQQAIKNATEHAEAHNIPVAIYQEAGEWKYCNAFDAYRNGYPVVQVVSKHFRTSPE